MRTKLGLLWTAAIRTYPDNDRRADKAAANAESTNARFFFDGGKLYHIHIIMDEFQKTDDFISFNFTIQLNDYSSCITISGAY